MRRSRLRAFIIRALVSIHASVKDATSSHSRSKRRLLSFNPRICKRCDQFRGFSYKEIIVSIHASVKDATKPTRGAIPCCGVSIHASVKDATALSRLKKNAFSFNPRICKRCDLKLPCDINCPLFVSIHASVKDATGNDFYIHIFRKVSIHASVKDATCQTIELRRSSQVSIHASVKDATPCL